MEITCRLLTKMRLAPAGVPKWIQKLGEVFETFGWDGRQIQETKDVFRGAIGISGQEMQLLQQCLVRMGLTPADRFRVIGDRAGKPVDDPFEKALANLQRSRVQ